MLSHSVKLPEVEHPLPLFRHYLQNGYYPFALENDFEIKMQQIINRTIEVYILQFSDMNAATGRKLKQLLSVICRNVPFKPNFSKIAGLIGVIRNKIADYFLLLEEAAMIFQLRDETGDIHGLGRINKVFLHNTNLIYGLANDNANIGNIRETFFLNQTRVLLDPISSDISDFKIGERTFEIGGKNKAQKQWQNTQTGFVVRDDIEFGYTNIIPFWQFGLLY